MNKKFDWKPINAGQRVQIIKDGDLQIGTEILVSRDKTYGTLLGASPGASVSPEVMRRCLELLLPSVCATQEAKEKKKRMFREDDLDKLAKDPDRYREIRDSVNECLRTSNMDNRQLDPYCLAALC